ncbi:MAG TPA: hypothetical protein PKM67_06275 [Kiritimatiellia bacterium]|nr:hypothetical protein [Kiritimatiellia bacterium]HNS81046.1 hypothetical protein [Kiritimatiellia bacterium]HPA78398.1 hypothetical protein [Kiritimatiellia bacterium]HQQ04421.1 hypothetical protein [Kiritimatiellia bacterium]
MEETKNLEHGTQPLDALLNGLEIANGDLVRASTEHLTFKVVQKGRRGRELTMRAQLKIVNALNRLRPDDPVRPADLFNYRGR